MNLRITNIISILLLAVMLALAVFSMKDDSATMDEVAHLPAGYSYLTQKDMRLNPEHPPLIKDLSAIPLLFIKGIKFPSEIRDWQSDVNGQWGFGYHFLYKTGNPADKMLFWARLPMVLILLLLGFYVFRTARELFGNKTALLSLFLFSFSPTFLAHGRLVTTDVGAAAGCFIATYYFLKYLSNPNKKNIALAGLSLGLTQLFKFSAVLLFPFFVFLIIAWWITKDESLLKLAKKTILVFVICFLIIGAVYQYHVWNYPAERQTSDTQVLLPHYKSALRAEVKNCLVWIADKPVIRAYGHYFTGLVMVFNRASYGHTTYFLGEVSNQGWKNYFPVVYAIKEPLGFHILTIMTLLYLAWLVKEPFWKNTFRRIRSWVVVHFSEFAMLAFIVLYWAVTLKSNLNIGIRHLLPTFPFIFVLVSGGITNWLTKPGWSWTKHSLVLGFLFFQFLSVLTVFPYFLTYFNELAGGPNNGYVYTVNSNLDWGQDLKRLTKWTEENKIEKIYVDYFGGGEAQYYLKEKYAPWWGNRDPKEFPKGNYLAVSATFLQTGRGQPGPGFDQATGYYRWLDTYTPIAKIGYSIFVYYID